MKPKATNSNLLAFKSKKIKRDERKPEISGPEELPSRDAEVSLPPIDPTSGNYTSIASRETSNPARTNLADTVTVESGSRRNLFSFNLFKSSRYRPDENRTTADFPVQQAHVQDSPKQVTFDGTALASDFERRRKRNLQICAFILLFAGVALAIGLGVGLSNNDSSDDDTGLAFSCGSPQKDQSVRDLIAARIDSANATLSVVFVPCLPDDAFGELSESQLIDIELSTTLTLSQIGLSAISPLAFSSLDTTGITFLDISQNSLTDLNFNVLSEFPALTNLDVSNNALTDLDFGLFADNPALEVLDVSANGFGTFPISLKEARALKTISFNNCLSLLNVEENYFDGNFPELTTLSLIQTISFLQYGGEQGFRDHASLPETVTIIS